MRKLLILSGAGISKESGLDTFRDKGGTWEKYDMDVVCNYTTWKDNFEAVHDFYNFRRAELQTVQPNAAHLKIAEWSKKYCVVNITQNVDNLFEKAGCENVVHLHGTLTRMQCTACGNVWFIGERAYDYATERCKCNSKRGVKPSVVLFNEDAPLYRVLYRELRGLTKDDVVLVIGTSGLVLSVNSLLFDSPATLILNNMEVSQHIDDSIFKHIFYIPATEAVLKIDTIIEEMNKNYLKSLII